MPNYKNKFISIIVLAVIFGFLSGIVGELIARIYLFEDTFNIPYFGEINLLQDYNGGSNIIIRDAKKVIVEQDVKIKEIVNEVSNGIFGLYKKISTSTINDLIDSTSTQKFNLGASYQIKDKIAAGFAITSDGWIITNFIPSGLTPKTTVGNKQNNINNKIYERYVFIANNKKIYEIDNIIPDDLTHYAFWHVAATDLPIRQFSTLDDINNGSQVLAINLEKWVFSATIVGQIYNGDSTVLSSDLAEHKLLLKERLSDEFAGSFLFDINGNLSGFINENNNVFAITNYIKPINSLLKNKNIKRVSLGVNYIDLSKLVMAGAYLIDKGALIYQNEKGVAVEIGSSAEKAGLRAGDIITAIDNIELDKNNNLTYLISKYLPADEIIISYLRAGVKREANVKLGEYK
ncbi:MAG: PDZ domain-containing protein [Patescibacteria group bacterium]|nr:PDZ domain-containing protein [Patescibacteria group bacterium]